MFQPHADIVFASLAGSDVARQYGLARRPECLIESVSVSEIPLTKKLGHEGMPGKVAEKGNPQNVHDDLRGGYLSWKPPDECLAAAGQYQRFARAERNAVAKDFRVAQGLQGFQGQIPDAYGASSGQEDDIRRKAVFSGQIRDVNTLALSAMLRPVADVSTFGIAPDRLGPLTASLKAALAGENGLSADVVFLSGPL